MVMLGMLCVAALVLFRGIMKRNETILVIGVALYAGTVIYIASHAPELVTAAIALAIIAAVLGLARILLVRSSPKRDGQLSEYFSDH